MIRAAGEADAAAIAGLHAASWRDAYRGMLSDALLDGPLAGRMAERWSAQLAAPAEGVVLLAGRDGAPAGFVAALQRGALAYVDNLHVRPGLRGARLGPTLLGEAARRMRDAGCTAAALHVFARNRRAIAFYARLGAAIGPEEPAELFGEAVPERRCDWPDIGALVSACAGRAAPPA